MAEGNYWSNIAVTAILGLGMNITATQTFAGEAPPVEKCYGIAKKDMNDCGANNHSCGGQAKKDSDPNEWIFVPTGTCKKIVGGVLKNK